MKIEIITRELKAVHTALGIHKERARRTGDDIGWLRAPLSRLRFCIAALEATEQDTVRLGRE